jgi:hypothetical protein
MKPVKVSVICLGTCAVVALGIPHLYSIGSHAFTVSQDRTQSADRLFEQLGRVQANQINESSGLAYSHKQNDAIWTLNDSGHGSELFLLNINGELQRTFQLAGAKNIDWEAMCSFEVDTQPYLLVADVGDNGFKRPKAQLYIVAEPDIDHPIQNQNQPTVLNRVTRIEFVYEDGPKNCEAVGVDPLTNECWLVEKVYYDSQQVKPPGVYVLPLVGVDSSQTLTAKRIGDFPVRNVTGMAFSPDRQRLIIRNYLHAHLFTRQNGDDWKTTIRQSKPIAVPLPLQRQGEAICFTPDSKSLIVTSELRRQAIWKVDLERYLLQQSKEAAPDGSRTDPLPGG